MQRLMSTMADPEYKAKVGLGSLRLASSPGCVMLSGGARSYWYSLWSGAKDDTNHRFLQQDDVCLLHRLGIHLLFSLMYYAVCLQRRLSLAGPVLCTRFDYTGC